MNYSKLGKDPWKHSNSDFINYFRR